MNAFEGPANRVTSYRMTESNVSTSSAAPEVRVLLIDDSKAARRTTQTQLSAAGFTVFTAEDGFSALSDLVEHRPDVIIADIVMPRLDGYQICALIKHSPEYQSTPVVLVSSRDGLFDRARGRLVGADAHLAKPVSDDELIRMIHQCLNTEVAEPEVESLPDATNSKRSDAQANTLNAENADDTFAVSPI